jgi:hypothetical protein
MCVYKGSTDDQDNFIADLKFYEGSNDTANWQAEVVSQNPNYNIDTSGEGSSDLFVTVNRAFANENYSPIWNIFEGVTDQSVRWTAHVGNLRFAVYDSGTSEDITDDLVWDRETGLVWERSPGSELLGWGEADLSCRQSPAGGRFGWRLPTIEELSTLLGASKSWSALPDGHPFEGVLSATYWSSTIASPPNSPASNGTPGIYAVLLASTGAVVTTRSPGSSNLAWCVRGG